MSKEMMILLASVYGLAILSAIIIGAYLIYWLNKRDKTRELHIAAWRRLRSQYLHEIQSEWSKNA
jgi:fucose permease